VWALERQNLKTTYETAHFAFHPARNYRSFVGANQSRYLSGERQQTARGAFAFGKDGRFLSRPIGSNVENSFSQASHVRSHQPGPRISLRWKARIGLSAGHQTISVSRTFTRRASAVLSRD